MCSYGIKCYRRNLEHFEDFDHPADHPLLLAPQPSPEPSPRIQFPKGRIDIDLTLASSDEEEGELWMSAFPAPASRMAIRINGLTMLQGTALGPQGVKAVRREILTGVGASTMAGVEARQDLHAAAASASISTSNVTSTASASVSTSSKEADLPCRVCKTVPSAGPTDLDMARDIMPPGWEPGQDGPTVMQVAGFH